MIKLFSVKDQNGTEITVNLYTITCILIPSSLMGGPGMAKVVCGTLNLDMSPNLALQIHDAWKKLNFDNRTVQ